MLKKKFGERAFWLLADSNEKSCTPKVNAWPVCGVVQLSHSSPATGLDERIWPHCLRWACCETLRMLLGSHCKALNKFSIFDERTPLAATFCSLTKVWALRFGDCAFLSLSLSLSQQAACSSLISKS